MQVSPASRSVSEKKSRKGAGAATAYTVPGTSFGAYDHPFPENAPEAQSVPLADVPGYISTYVPETPPPTEAEIRKLERKLKLEKKRKEQEKVKAKKRFRGYVKLCLLLTVGIAALIVLALTAGFLTRKITAPDACRVCLMAWETEEAPDFFGNAWKKDNTLNMLTSKTSGLTVYKDQTLYLNFTDIAELFDLTVAGDYRHLRFINVGADNQNAAFVMNSTEAYVNGQAIRLSHAAFRSSDGDVYIPVDFFEHYVTGVAFTYAAAQKDLFIQRLYDYDGHSDGAYSPLTYTLSAQNPTEHIAEISLPPSILYDTDPYRNK